MHAIRSVLWIGPATGLSASGVLECPTLDVTWVPDVGDALVLPPASFDAEVVDGLPTARLADSVRRLRRGPRWDWLAGRTRRCALGILSGGRSGGFGSNSRR